MKPSFDSLTLSCAIDELQPLVGAQVQRLTVRPDLQVILSAYQEAMGEKHWLFDVSPSWARTHLTRSAPPKKSSNPLPFEQALRKYVLDGIICRIAGRGFDRIIEVDIDGPQGQVQLVGEFTGNRSNLILCRTDKNGDRIILHAAKLTTPKQSRQREILPGCVYQELARQGLDPRDYLRRDSSTSLVSRLGHDDVDNAFEALSPPTEKVLFGPWLKSTFEGMSPILEREIIDHATQSLWQGFHSVIDKIGNWQPGYYEDSAGDLVLAYSFELHHLKSTFGWHPASSIHEALEKVYRQAMPVAALKQQKSTFEGIVKKAIKQDEYALQQLQHGLAESGRAAKHRSAGELLFAHLGEVPSGAERVILKDFYSGQDVVLALDKEMSPAENAARYFERAKHSEAGRASLQTRHNEIEAKLQQHRQLLERIEKAVSLQELQEHQALLASPSGGAVAVPQQKKAVPRFEGHRIKTLQSPDGYTVLVGENATSNDYLVRRIMKTNDWWLHVRGATSAHAVVQSNGHPQKVPQNTLLFAARQVAARSAAKHAGYAAVDYTLGKYVRKPRKSPPGSVVCEQEKTLHLMKDE